MTLMEVGNTGTKEKQSRSNRSAIRQSPSSSPRDVHHSLSYSAGTRDVHRGPSYSAGTRDVHRSPSYSAGTKSPTQEDEEWCCWPPSFNQLKLGLCPPLPNSVLNSLLLKPPHEDAGTLSLKHPQFCCFGKYPWRSPYLLQVINPSFSRAGLGCVFWLDAHQEGNPVLG